MEELFPLLVVFIGAIGSIVSAASKSKNNKTAMSAHRSAAAERFNAAREQAAPQPTAQGAALPPRPGQVITPTVHTHLQPDCDTHDKPGSLGVTSMEGKDPCHASQLTRVQPDMEAAPESPAITFDWTGENMVKAFVMQEILTRPCQRQAR